MIYDLSQPGEDYNHQTWGEKLHSPLSVLQQLFFLRTTLYLFKKKKKENTVCFIKL